MAITATFLSAAFAAAVLNKRKAMALSSVRFARSRNRGGSVRDAGRSIGVSGATVSRIEAGKMVDVLTYAKVCVWLGCSLDKFVERSPWQLEI